MPSPRKSFEKKVLESPFFVIALLVIIFLTVSAMVKMFYRSQQIKSETQQLQETIVELNGKNEELTSQKKYYTSEYFVEKEARLRLNLKRPGERVVFINYDEEDLKKQQQREDLPMIVLNFLDWWDYFFSSKKDNG